MELKSGLPFSLIKTGMPAVFPKLEADIKADVVIVGGGISGSLVAYHLVNAGVDCIVVDARTIGLGSTCASTSLLQYEIDTPLSELIELRGERAAVRAYKLCERAISELGAIAKNIKFNGFSLKESLYFAAKQGDRSFLREEFEIRKKHGFPVHLLESEEVFSEFAFKTPAAILSESGGAADAYMFTHKLLEFSQRKSLRVFDRTEVTRIDHAKNAIRLTTKEGRSITAAKMVNATGYEVVNFIDKKIVTLSSTYAIISESFTEKPAYGCHDALLWNTADPYLYSRITDDNRFIVGGRDEEFYSPGKRDALIHKKANQLRKDFAKLFPGIVFNTEFSWTGTFGSTADGLPYIGEYKKVPNTYFALGFGGNGITFSQIAGKIIADLFTGRKNRDAELFAFDR